MRKAIKGGSRLGRNIEKDKTLQIAKKNMLCGNTWSIFQSTK